MENLLILSAVLLGLALLQALVGILFFRPGPSLLSFFFQSLFLFAAAVLALGFTFQQHRVWGWLCLGAVFIFFLEGSLAEIFFAHRK